MFTNISLKTQNAKYGPKNLFLIDFSPLVGKYSLLSKYLPRESSPETLRLTSIASFVAYHHFSQSNRRYRSIPRRLYTLSDGRIFSFHPNSMKLLTASDIQTISRTAWPNSRLLYTLYRDGRGRCHMTQQLRDREEC